MAAGGVTGLFFVGFFSKLWSRVTQNRKERNEFAKEIVAEIADIREKAEEQKESYKTSITDLKQQHATEIKRLNGEIETLREQKREETTEKAKLTERVKYLEEQLQKTILKAEKERQEESAKIEKLRSDVEIYLQDYHRVSEEKEELENQRNSDRELIIELREANIALINKIEGIREGIQENKEPIMELAKTLNNIAKAITDPKPEPPDPKPPKIHKLPSEERTKDDETSDKQDAA